MSDFSQQKGAQITAQIPIDWDQLTLTVENGPLPLSSLAMMDTNPDPSLIATTEFMTQSNCVDDKRILFPIFWLDDDVDSGNILKCYQETASNGFTVNRTRE